MKRRELKLTDILPYCVYHLEVEFEDRKCIIESVNFTYSSIIVYDALENRHIVTHLKEIKLILLSFKDTPKECMEEIIQILNDENQGYIFIKDFTFNNSINSWRLNYSVTENGDSCKYILIPSDFCLDRSINRFFPVKKILEVFYKYQVDIGGLIEDGLAISK